MRNVSSEGFVFLAEYGQAYLPEHPQGGQDDRDHDTPEIHLRTPPCTNYQLTILTHRADTSSSLGYKDLLIGRLEVAGVNSDVRGHEDADELDSVF